MAERAGRTLQSDAVLPETDPLARRRTERLAELDEVAKLRQTAELHIDIDIDLRVDDPTELRADDALDALARKEGSVGVTILVQHSSLRRWDRLHDEPDRPEDQLAPLP